VEIKKNGLFIVENTAARHDARVWPEALVAQKKAMTPPQLSGFSNR
jgi:hypothetical protein